MVLKLGINMYFVWFLYKVISATTGPARIICFRRFRVAYKYSCVYTTFQVYIKKN